MKLYLKANNLKILKNHLNLLHYAHSKTAMLLDENAHNEYHINLQSAQKLQEHAKELFYDERALDKVVKGVYFSNSSCEHLVASMSEIVEAKKLCEKHHYNFVFVFAPLSEFKMQEAREILAFLNSEAKACEVVVNDIGLLQLALEFEYIVVVLGLNFTKVIKNAFIDTVNPTELSTQTLEQQQELLAHIEFENHDLRHFYKELGVGRFSIENTNINLEFLKQSPKMSVDFYYPYITLANSKACDIAGSFEDQRTFFVHKECSKFCNYASLEFSDSKTLNIRQAYNTLYKSNIKLELDKELCKSAKNRLVWELFV